jgi:two-component system phosphate regulon response regulator PhoB
MIKETIFVVEDDEDIQELIRFNLSKEGYSVKSFSTGETMLPLLSNTPVGCVILDLMLPGMDGLEICRKIRQAKETAHIPIIMVTAKGSEADIVTGLELGADDYIVKPFSIRILIARLKAVLRREQQEKDLDQKPLSINAIDIHPGRREVKIAGQPVELTSSEFKALYLLANRPGWVFTRYQIVEDVHGINYPVTDRSVDVLMVGLRKKLGAAGDSIDTVRGMGYRFKDKE